MKKEDTIVYSLGECRYDSPLDIPQFIGSDERVIFDVDYAKVSRAFSENNEALSFENAGPRIWNNYFTFLPIETAIRQRKTIDPNGYLWSIVKESTGQPDFYY
jgi:hypothetical protein